ncbi:PFL_4703 family integrating conjugative element protein [Pseudomonas fluorescens]|uniref:PFL_4703 family integrating conjugative element protein n=1 Tax=Pseudomonas fluorescens TaxID=294 RepID=UPI001BE589B5|nr:TIGR03746 family integrating conjugative element protein [Pseudomonas fluorescens]MBT2375330.1 TIGR03746 family integrating conjugative element protein [Pseudomonas fluorescens]
MSRFKNEVLHLQAHVRTLRSAAAALFVLTLGLAIGWWSAPRDLTVHIPPDLHVGSSRKWWDVPPASVYAFSFYIFQQLHRWPSDGEQDYARNLEALSAYLTPACKAFLQRDYEARRSTGELRGRVRGVYEIPGRGYGNDPARRVQSISRNDWRVTLDLSADEYFAAEQVKRALVRYSLKVVRRDIDPERNPFGLALDCFSQPPQRIAVPATGSPTSPSSAASPASGESK